MSAASFSAKRYKIHSVFLTVQGEGKNIGRRAVFVRFSGCNVWSGLEEHRARGTSACARICDTQFHSFVPTKGGGFYHKEQLADFVETLWCDSQHAPFVVLTGGEPSIQVDQELVDHFERRGFESAIETNGSNLLPKGIGHVCLSPKPPVEVVSQRYDEVKVLFPLYDPRNFEGYTQGPLWVQPVEDANWDSNVQKALEFVDDNANWRLSIQAHKWWGID